MSGAATRARGGLERVLRLLLLVPSLLGAQTESDATGPLEDQIDVVPVDRRVLAVNSRSGRVIEASLELGEELLWYENRGAVGVVATSVRLLGATARSANWQELRYRIAEREPPPAELFLGERVALVPLGTRLVALGQGSARWSELGLGTREVVLHAEATRNVALAVTGRRAIAFPSESAGFAEIALSPGEAPEGISLEDSSVTLTTSRRILLFRVGAVRWSELVRVDRPPTGR